MKPREICRDIFGLAVRLTGLYFLYRGLVSVPPLLDLGALETSNLNDVANEVLPIAFDLAVAWWLIGNRFLVRRAYPEEWRANSSLGQTPPPSPLASSAKTADRTAADDKLAALVGKPKEPPST